MKITNIEVLQLNNALTELMRQPMTGKVKFTIAKNKYALEQAVIPLEKALETTEQGGVVNSKENTDVLEMEVDIKLEMLQESDLFDLAISPQSIMLLQKIIKQESEVE